MNGSNLNWLVLLYVYALILIDSTKLSTGSSAILRSVSIELSDDLEVLKNEELGSEYIKKLYSSFKYRPTIVDANRTLNEMADRLEEKIIDIFAALNHAKVAIESMEMIENSTNSHSALMPCVDHSENDRDFSVCGNFINIILNKSSKEVDYVLQRLKTDNKTWNVKNAIKQQYLISSYDVESSELSPFLHCKGQDHMLLWSSFMSRNFYLPRKIVLLLDHGGSLSKQHFLLVKTVAKGMVSALGESDSLAIIAISSDWSAPELSDECLMPNQVPLTLSDNDNPKFFTLNKRRKKLINKFIDGLEKGIGATNHTKGLTKALKIVESNQIDNEMVMILYISRGLLSSLTEAKVVLGTIFERSKSIRNRLIINTCAVIDESRPTIYETQFLRDIAVQDYQKYNITNRIGPGGVMIAVNSSEMVGFAIGKFYNMYKSGRYDLSSTISKPKWDPISNDLTVSFSLGSSINDEFSLLGVDILFENWAEDFLYFCGSQRHHYAFLMDLGGEVLMHPAFSCPTTVMQQLNYVDIGHFERVPGFETFRTRLLKELQGVHVIAQPTYVRKYTWRRVGTWYVMCVVIRDIHTTSVRPHQVYWPLNSSDGYNLKFIHQHLGDKPQLCRHLNQVATLDAGSLYLSKSCFRSVQKQRNYQNYMAYLEDNSHVTTNPGLKDEIKDEVAVLVHILTFLRNRHLASVKSRYIVRRYVASHGGVLQMFPGSIIDDGLDPTKRPWFVQANEHKNRVVMTPPYLDEGGAGYIVTIAYATTYAVVACDVTYGYIFRMLLKRLSLCSSSNITCFLMDDRGYLVYHPNLIDPNGIGPVEKQHIVHKESLVANDILAHSLFIKKSLCNSYGGGTIQRFYKLNTSYAEVLVNAVQGEACVSYYIASIPDTNVFVGMVNATCNIVVTFCPCSIVDRLCLNCNRMEQKECECPCECPMETARCGDSFDNSICTWFPEQVSHSPHFDENTRGLKSCFPATCSEEKSHLGCLGIAGCEWCIYDVDGTFLTNPFCASLATCFNGVVGSITPYANLDDSPKSLSVPMSFIILFVLGVLVLLCMFYIYHRSTNRPVAERLYLSSGVTHQDNHLRMSDLNLGDNFHTISHRDKLLQEEKPDPVSPYCVSSGYRRIAMAADSDHGYSTMTQHDESEHMSLNAPVELDSLDDDIGSDHKSTTPPQLNSLTEFTCVPLIHHNHNNRIIVPVTVHRNMDTT